MSRWFRFHVATLNSAKVQRLSPELFKAWINLLCVACENDGTIPADNDEIGFALRTTADKARRLVDDLVCAGLLDETDDGLRPHDWNEWQYQSDRSTERVKRFRERSMKRRETVSETPSETETESETDTEQIRTEVGARSRAPTATRLPDDWQPSDALLAWAKANEPRVDAARETLKFLDYWRAASGAKARKHDWDAAWRGWLRKASDGAQAPTTTPFRRLGTVAPTAGGGPIDTSSDGPLAALAAENRRRHKLGQPPMDAAALAAWRAAQTQQEDVA